MANAGIPSQRKLGEALGASQSTAQRLVGKDDEEPESITDPADIKFGTIVKLSGILQVPVNAFQSYTGEKGSASPLADEDFVTAVQKVHTLLGEELQKQYKQKTKTMYLPPPRKLLQGQNLEAIASQTKIPVQTLGRIQQGLPVSEKELKSIQAVGLIQFFYDKQHFENWDEWRVLLRNGDHLNGSSESTEFTVVSD